MVIAEFVTEPQAAEIMGTNMFGFQALARCLEARVGVRPEEHNVPFPADFLDKHRDDAVLAVVPPPENIMRVRMVQCLNAAAQKEYRQWSPFFLGYQGFRWALLRKHGVTDSLGKSWEEQQRMVPEGERIASSYVCINVGAMGLINAGEPLFEQTTRCQGLASPVHLKTPDCGKLLLLYHAPTSPFCGLATEFVP